MKSSASITRRLTLSVLLLELLAALVLIAIVTNHERRVQFETFDANLRATANALLGAVQEADTKDGSVRLDIHGMNLPRRAVFRVTEGNGRVLGESGDVPLVSLESGTVSPARVLGRPFRFYVLTGTRVIDPNSPRAVLHNVTVVYGLPEGKTWHAIFEATRFFAIATLILLGITAAFMWWLVHRLLRPIHELAHEAEIVDAEHWRFSAPENSKKFRELQPLASAIEKTIARLHRSFEQQQQFTSDAAHELKTDLAIVKSSVQLLTMKRRSIEEYEHGLALSLGDIGRLESTVQKMLTLARLEQSPTIEQCVCDFAGAVEDAVAQSQPYAEIKDIAVMASGLQIGKEVPLDPEDALLLCSNILVNAIQHSHPQGRVEVVLSHDSRNVQLHIRDYGEGIADEDLPFLFDPFYRGDISRSRKSGGTGLGLSICKAICDRVGGTIAIENRTEGGAEVIVLLPLICHKDAISSAD